jgi:MarR family transcriptional regulator, temperature-dependent positive regulator of motility
LTRSAPQPFPPEDLLLHPGHLLRRSLQAMNLIWVRDVSRSITSPQFAALNALLREPNIDQRSLGRRISLDRSTTAEVVARLTTRGLIRGKRDVHDGRRKTLELTPRGEHELQQLIPRTYVLTEKLVAALNERERQELLRLLALVVQSSEPPPNGEMSRRPHPARTGRRKSAS